jgi:hypothetical protein
LQNKRGAPTETIFDDSGLKGSEITGDIVKWLVYDSLEDKVMMTLDTHNFAVIVVATFVVGSVSAVSSTVIKDIGSSIEQKKKYANRMKREAGQKPKLNEIQNPVVRTFNTRNTTKTVPTKVTGTEKFSVLKPVVPKYASSAIEGGVLFASYQVMTKIVAMIVPESFNVKFVFNQVLENIEREIDPDIV